MKKLTILHLIGLAIVSVLTIGALREGDSALAAQKEFSSTPDPDVVECLRDRSEQILHDRLQEIRPQETVYFVREQDIGEIYSPQVIGENRIGVVSTQADLVERVSSAEDISGIYLHPDVLESVDPDWLRQQYENGVAIIGLNILVSDLGSKLGIDAPMEDLKLSYRRGRPFVAIYRTAEGHGGIVEEAVYADFVDSASSIPMLVARTLDTHHLTKEYQDQMQQCVEGQ